jgi:ribosomal-protein-alanine N-acetyltransferase
VLDAIDEARRVAAATVVRCVGPGAARWREVIEARFPGATAEPHRFDGLSAVDLADAVLARGGPAAGLAPSGEPVRPLYVRSAQAEERVRHRVSAALPLTLRAFGAADIPAVVAIEQRVFSDPWPASFFAGELDQPLTWARIAEREGAIVGYALAWLGVGGGHLGNLAVVEAERRRGVAHALLADLFTAARARGVDRIALEVRVSNDPAQALYRAHGFGLAGLRRGYYRDTSEDALIMEWRAQGPGT